MMSAPPRPSRAIQYRVPATTPNATSLVKNPPFSRSSLPATSTRSANPVPVYTASRVSKALPVVSMRTRPVTGAVHRYHTDPEE